MKCLITYARTLGVVVAVGVGFFLGCTALLDWHLHDSKVSVEEKTIELEGEPAEEVRTVPSEEPGDQVDQVERIE